MLRSILFILATLMLISCGSKAELSFESQDKTNHIDLKGSKSSSLDPWIIELIATKPELSKTFHVEFFNSSMTNETVKV
ncbi:MAG: hypothetical protein H7259_03590, partial [Cytophagales bacterium]|nr:hypothetical protein [Cytophaga sp.]